MNLIKKINLSTIIMILPLSAIADWSGYDWNSSSFVDITSGSLVREGNDIEIYDWGVGQYKDVTVETMNCSNTLYNSCEIEVYDWTTNKYRTLDMD